MQAPSFEVPLKAARADELLFDDGCPKATDIGLFMPPFAKREPRLPIFSRGFGEGIETFGVMTGACLHGQAIRGHPWRADLSTKLTTIHDKQPDSAITLRTLWGAAIPTGVMTSNMEVIQSSGSFQRPQGRIWTLIKIPDRG